MAVVVKVADQGHIHTHAVQLLANGRHGLGGFRRVHRDAHQLRPGRGQLFDLDGGANHIHRVGIGHRLDANRRIASHGDHFRAPLDLPLQAVADLCMRDMDGFVHGINSRFGGLGRRMGRIWLQRHGGHRRDHHILIHRLWFTGLDLHGHSAQTWRGRPRCGHGWCFQNWH